MTHPLARLLVALIFALGVGRPDRPQYDAPTLDADHSHEASPFKPRMVLAAVVSAPSPVLCRIDEPAAPRPVRATLEASVGVSRGPPIG